jgi:hypothetical protein
MSIKKSLYSDFYTAYCKAHPDETKQHQQDKVNSFWNENKKKKDFPEIVKRKLEELEVKYLKTKSQLASFWAKASTSTAQSKASNPDNDTGIYS